MIQPSRLKSLDEQARVAVRRLYDWQHNGSTSFTAQLYTLMNKADQFNFSRLSSVFPMEACALISWRNASDVDAFFKEHGAIQ